MMQQTTIIAYLDAIVSEGTFTQAAKSLYISQPYLSKTITKLEEELQTQLVERNRTPMELTYAGERFLTHMKKMQNHFSGKEIRDVRWPEDVLVTSIRRGQQNVVATGKTIMQTGDVLHVLTDLGLAKTVQEELKQLEKRRLFDT